MCVCRYNVCHEHVGTHAYWKQVLDPLALELQVVATNLCLLVRVGTIHVCPAMCVAIPGCWCKINYDENIYMTEFGKH